MGPWCAHLLLRAPAVARPTRLSAQADAVFRQVWVRMAVSARDALCAGCLTCPPVQDCFPEAAAATLGRWKAGCLPRAGPAGTLPHSLCTFFTLTTAQCLHINREAVNMAGSVLGTFPYSEEKGGIQDKNRKQPTNQFLFKHIFYLLST